MRAVYFLSANKEPAIAREETKKNYIYIKMQIMFIILHIAKYHLYGWKEHVLVVIYEKCQVNSSLD